VFVGGEPLARLTSKHVFHLGMAANLVEFPAVARGKARFRFQVMANHKLEDMDRAAEIMAEAKALGMSELAEIMKLEKPEGIEG
jgi:7-keto-8-aminopelargonate synthetase-like enzyme